MNKKTFHTGRIKQKLQTRSDIIQAAKRLMQNNEKITLEDVAKETNISRATVYRYFSHIDNLLTEASLDFFHKTPDQLFEEVKEMSLKGRVLYLQKYYTKLAEENEVVFRRYLSAVLSESVTSKEKLRGARRTISFTKALDPFKGKLGNEDLNNLITISSVLTGIDSLIVCKDVCNLTNQESKVVLKWGMEMILQGISIKENNL